MEATIPPPSLRFHRKKAQKFYKKHQDRRVSIDDNAASVSSLDDSSTCSYDISSKNSNSSSFQMNYSVNSKSDNSINANYLTKQQNQQNLKLQRQSMVKLGKSEQSQYSQSTLAVDGTEKQFKSVRELANQFEKLSKEEKIIYSNRPLIKLRTEVPWKSTLPESFEANEKNKVNSTDGNLSDTDVRPFNEVQSEEEVEDIAYECDKNFIITDVRDSSSIEQIQPQIQEARPFVVNDLFDEDDEQLTDDNEENLNTIDKTVDNNFVRNFRSKERPKTELVAIKNQPLVTKYYSYNSNSKLTKISDNEFNDNDDDHNISKPIKPNSINPENPDDDDDDCIIRDKRPLAAAPIIEELIKTEENYIENLRNGIKNYGTIFARRDLPSGLRGKKFDLLGNIEQICDFHEFEFLPMLLKYSADLKRLFDEFLTFIDENCFYGYVLFTMNKKRSLKLCEDFNPYFKYLQEELDDKLGINSFLVQPIQRLARYPLLLSQFINTLFKTGDIKYKSIIDSCCKADKRLRILLTTTNESEQINDITECFDIDVLNQGRFMKVSEFNVFDYTLRRTYRSKVFIFDRCLIYTEIKDKRLIFRGCYPCESIGYIPKQKMFILYYQTRKIQECHFTADPSIIDIWLTLIQDMINNFAIEEKKKLKARYSDRNSNDQSSNYRPSNVQLYRYSNRYSSDSGIGNVWNMPKLTDDEDKSTFDKLNNQRTTWYMT